MRLISCSECGSLVKGNKTSLVGHKRVCHQCKKKLEKKQVAFFRKQVIRGRNDGGEENDKMPVSRLQEKCK